MQDHIKQIFIGVILATLIALPASAYFIQSSQATLKNEIIRLSDNLNRVNESLEAVRDNQIELERRSVWMTNVEKRLDLLEHKIDSVDERTDELFSKEDATRMEQRMNKRLDKIEENISVKH